MQETLFSPRASDLKPRNHYERMVTILEAYSRTGTMTLEHLALPHMLNRSVRTLQTYCNTAGLIFPDWTPNRLRKKAKRVAKSKRRSRPSVAGLSA